ncbi:unnamed protein product [Schistocephalus solidus]|uniref:Tox-REase-5 domain-containing protein n=1 Tax=Schistocephalus solidus TaxID=70667 RepID=A0A183T8Y8_SCHSO|nr:unnamed protein product [Schistocephalus solidus]
MGIRGHQAAEMTRQNPGHGRVGTNRPSQHLRTTETTAPALEWPPGENGVFAMGSRRQRGQVGRYKDTLETSLKQIQINPANWEDFARNEPAWKKAVKTEAANYDANRITVAKAKRAARKSPASRTHTANTQVLPTHLRCRRTFRA